MKNENVCPVHRGNALARPIKPRSWSLLRDLGSFPKATLAPVKLSVCLLFLLGFNCVAQTNYPPNSAPWNVDPTNWVYDCSFQGYGNVIPNASYLPCGYYDEPLLTNSVPFERVLNPYGLTVVLLSVTNTMSFSIHGLATNTAVVLLVYNEVPDTLYTVFYSTNLASLTNSHSVYYTSTSMADTVSFQVYSGVVSNCFFVVNGENYPFPTGTQIRDFDSEGLKTLREF